MVVIQITADNVQHHSSTWQRGEEPTVARWLAAKLIFEGRAIFIMDGCGCNRKRSV
jgi:hypothetical protein